MEPTSSEYALVYPMCVMVLLSFVVVVALFRTRVALVRAGQLDPRYFAIYQGGGEPEASAKLARHFSNLFEAPVLFYAACLAAMVTGQSTPLVNGLAWLYVATRGVHTFIHTGRNVITHRVAVYFTSWVVLVALWLAITLGVATQAP